MNWRQLLALVACVSLIVITGSALAEEVTVIRCYPRPQGHLPQAAEVYSGALAQQLVDALAPRNHLPPISSIVIERRGPDVAVVILSGAMACPIPVERGDWEAARRTVLGLGA